MPQVVDIDSAITLIRNVEVHHNTAPNPYARAVLEHLDQVGGTWVEARLDERLVGCGVLLPDRGALTLGLLGLDYSVNYAYFQLMYAAIRHAIESGATVLRGGSGAYDLKSRLGFQQEPYSSIAFLLANPLLRRIAQWM